MYFTEEENIYVETIFSENIENIQKVLKAFGVDKAKYYRESNSYFLINGLGHAVLQCRYGSDSKTFTIETGFREKVLRFDFTNLTDQRCWTSKETYYSLISMKFIEVAKLRVEVVRYDNNS